MRITFDQAADAMYIYLAKGDIAKTAERGEYLVDYGKNGEMIGIEILGVSKKLEVRKRMTTSA